MSYKIPNPEILKKREEFNKECNNPEFLEIFNKSQKIKTFLNPIHNKNTNRSYKKGLKNYFCKLKTTDIDKYIIAKSKLSNLKYEEYETTLKNDITTVYNFLNNELDYSGTGLKTFSWSIRGLLEDNNIYINGKFYKKLNSNNNKSTDRQTDMKTPDKKTLEEIFKKMTTEELALFGIKKDTGWRLEDILQIEEDNIRYFDTDYPLIYVPKSSKIKRNLKCCITPQTKKWLQDYKEKRDHILKIRQNRAKPKTNKLLDKSKLFPMDEGNALSMWRTIIKNSIGYIKGKKTNKPIIGSHRLRDYFLGSFSYSNIGLFLCGKGKRSNYDYYMGQPDNYIIEEYKKYADRLLLFNDENTNKIEIDKINQNVIDLTKELESRDLIIKKLDGASQIEKIKVSNLEQQIKNLTDIVNAYIQDSIKPLPYDIKTRPQENFSPEQEKFIEKTENKIINKRYNEIKKRLKDNEKIIKRYGLPYILKKDKKSPKADELFYMTQHMNATILLSSLEPKEQIKLIKNVNQKKTSNDTFNYIKRLTPKEIKKLLEEVKKFKQTFNIDYPKDKI